MSETGYDSTPPKFATTAVPPAPGSDIAVAMGCTCPRMDNGYGRGYMGQRHIFIYTIGCPVHAPLPRSP